MDRQRERASHRVQAGGGGRAGPRLRLRLGLQRASNQRRQGRGQRARSCLDDLRQARAVQRLRRHPLPAPRSECLRGDAGRRLVPLKGTASANEY